MLGLLGGLCAIVSIVCWIIILIHAFQNSVGMGILCFCIFPVAIWYAFAKFEHEKKGLIIGGYLGGAVLSCIFQIAGGLGSM